MKVDKNARKTARRVHKRGLMKRAQFRACDKAEGIIQLESKFEGSVALALSLDPRVISFRPQPMTIDLNTGRIFASKDLLFEACKGSGVKPRVYTPDFEVKLERRTIFVESKASKLIERSPEILTFPEIFTSFGLDLIVIDNSGFPEAYRQNLRLINLSRHTELSESIRAKFRSLGTSGGIGIGELKRDGISQNAVLAGIAAELLECDLVSDRLRDSTIVWSGTAQSRHLRRLPL